MCDDDDDDDDDNDDDDGTRAYKNELARYFSTLTRIDCGMAEKNKCYQSLKSNQIRPHGGKRDGDTV